MRTLALAAVALLGGTFLSTSANAQCPTFPGTSSSGCSAVITITNTSANVGPGPATGPYDGSDDTLVGIVNNSTPCATNKTNGCGLTISSIDLISGNNICGFDGDGIDTFGAPSNPKDTFGYGGPNAFFTNINATQTGCRVNFVTPLKPGDSTYFSLENALSTANACTSVLNMGLQTQVGTASKANICATFTPQGTDPNTGMAYTLASAAALCGFTKFNWTQQITKQFDPSAFSARNSGGGFDASIAGSVRLTSKRVPWSDPPQGGGYAQGGGGQATADNSYPFYYDPNVDLPAHLNGSAVNDCALTLTPAGNVLSFHDAPDDPCLPGGGSVGTAACTDAVNAPGVTEEPAGSFGGYQTHLAGVNADGTATDTGIGFSWTSDYNGTTGGVVIKKTDAGADNNGTGGVTITNVTQTSTFTGVMVSAVNGSNPSSIFGSTSLVTAVLPESRSAQPNGTVTAFATIINTGATTALGCSIAPATSLPGTFAYQTTNPSTNALTGTVNTPVDIPGNDGSQSFVIAFTPSAAIAPTDQAFNFACTGVSPALVVGGLNTLLLSASTTTPTPDVIALGATLQNDGIVHVTGTPMQGVFAVASDNLGSSDSITVATNTGPATLPLTIALCQTNPSTGACLQPPSATVTTTIGTGATPTFGVFVSASNTVPFDPANSRIFVTFTDSTNAVRGETSVAVETQ